MKRVLPLVALIALGDIAAPATAQRCDPSYPTVCIPPPPPDLNCPDVPYTDFEVRGSDPHGFDRDHDGIGCESRR